MVIVAVAIIMSIVQANVFMLEMQDAISDGSTSINHSRCALVPILVSHVSLVYITTHANI